MFAQAEAATSKSESDQAKATIQTNKNLWEKPKKIAALAHYAFQKQDILITAQKNHIKLLLDSIEELKSANNNLQNQVAHSQRTIVRLKQVLRETKQQLKGKEEFWATSLQQINFYVEALKQNMETQNTIQQTYPFLTSLIESSGMQQNLQPTTQQLLLRTEDQ